MKKLKMPQKGKACSCCQSQHGMGRKQRRAKGRSTRQLNPDDPYMREEQRAGDTCSNDNKGVEASEGRRGKDFKNRQK